MSGDLFLVFGGDPEALFLGIGTGLIVGVIVEFARLAILYFKELTRD